MIKNLALALTILSFAGCSTTPTNYREFDPSLSVHVEKRSFLHGVQPKQGEKEISPDALYEHLKTAPYSRYEISKFERKQKTHSILNFVNLGLIVGGAASSDDSTKGILLSTALISIIVDMFIQESAYTNADKAIENHNNYIQQQKQKTDPLRDRSQ